MTLTIVHFIVGAELVSKANFPLGWSLGCDSSPPETGVMFGKTDLTLHPIDCINYRDKSLLGIMGNPAINLAHHVEDT